jgi:dihydropteroate synthase
VNDVSAFKWYPNMAATVAELGCGAILMHTRGLPTEWRSQPVAEDLLGLVASELSQAVERAMAAGVQRDRMVLDPGFGFGKSFEENYPLLAHFDRFAELGFPLVAGTSRKSFIGRTVGRRLAELHASSGNDQPAAERLYGTLATVVAAILKGAHLVRVHDVRAAVEAAAIADAVLAAE